MTDDKCPECGEPLDYDEVDIGVGVQRGNYGCPNCGWTPQGLAIEEDDLDIPPHKLSRQERLEGLADRGYDTLDWEER